MEEQALGRTQMGVPAGEEEPAAEVFPAEVLRMKEPQMEAVYAEALVEALAVLTVEV